MNARPPATRREIMKENEEMGSGYIMVWFCAANATRTRQRPRLRALARANPFPLSPRRIYIEVGGESHA